MSLLQPLELKKAIRPLDRGVDAVALLDVLLIAGIFYLLSSRFIFAPGLSMDVDGGFPLPEVSTGTMQALPAVEVMTVKNADMILFDGRFYKLADLEQQLVTQEGKPTDRGVLLLRLNRSVNIDTLFRISDWARVSGFSRVQLAAGQRDIETGQIVTP